MKPFRFLNRFFKPKESPGLGGEIPPMQIKKPPRPGHWADRPSRTMVYPETVVMPGAGNSKRQQKPHVDQPTDFAHTVETHKASATRKPTHHHVDVDNSAEFLALVRSCLGNKAQAVRLVDFEQSKNPSLSRKEAAIRAAERLVRDQGMF